MYMFYKCTILFTYNIYDKTPYRILQVKEKTKLLQKFFLEEPIVRSRFVCKKYYQQLYIQIKETPTITQLLKTD